MLALPINRRYTQNLKQLSLVLYLAFPRPKLLSFSSHDLYKYNVKLSAMIRARQLDAAQSLFDSMPVKDVVTWNALIAGYSQNGLLKESKRLFDSMPARNVVSWNCMVAACVENQQIDEAFYYFRAMPEKNTASYNAMISGFLKFDRFKDACKLFEEMPGRNVISYTAMINGLAKRGEVGCARVLFDNMPHRNTVSWAAMIKGYVENGFLVKARELFDCMPDKNAIAITTMITGYCKERKLQDARTLFEQIHVRDRISWNVMITGYAQNGQDEEALRLFLVMHKCGMSPDQSTLVSIFTACSALASVKEGIQTHSLVIKLGFESNVSVCNALITMYSKCGLILYSEEVFGQMHSPVLVSWNTMIAACAQHGIYTKAIAYFKRMRIIGLKPDGITFLSMLSACSHAGKVDESAKLFELMQNYYLIDPRPEHYACLVDNLCRAGLLEKACKIIQEMPAKVDSGIWGSLLASCAVNLNVELGELAAKQIFRLNPGNSGAYIMLSNMYAAAHEHKDVMRVRLLMKKQGVKKQRAYSSVEIGSKVHHFLGGDVSHPDIIVIHDALKRMSSHMKEHRSMAWKNIVWRVGDLAGKAAMEELFHKLMLFTLAPLKLLYFQTDRILKLNLLLVVTHRKVFQSCI